jgi:hypothetical protein
MTNLLHANNRAIPENLGKDSKSPQYPPIVLGQSLVDDWNRFSPEVTGGGLSSNKRKSWSSVAVWPRGVVNETHNALTPGNSIGTFWTNTALY